MKLTQISELLDEIKMNEIANRVEIYTINIQPPNSRKQTRERFEENFISKNNQLILRSLQSKSIKSREEIMFLEENRPEDVDNILATEHPLLSLDHSICQNQDSPEKISGIKQESQVKKKKSLRFEDIDFLIDLRKKINQPEDQDETEKLFVKIKTDELLCCILTLMGMGSSIIYYQMKTASLSRPASQADYSSFDYSISFSLITCTICNVLYSKKRVNYLCIVFSYFNRIQIS